MPRRLEPEDLIGSAGRLEALWLLPPTAPRGAALVCHPHPQHGGTMHTKAVYRVARGLEEQGFAVLRFNYRGVGRSAGAFDQGAGELDDTRRAWKCVMDKHPNPPHVLGGFSFGSYMSLQVGLADPRAAVLLGIGLPLAKYDFSFLTQLDKPLLVVVGQNDPFCPANYRDELLQRLGPQLELVVLPGAGHLLTEALPALQSAVETFVEKHFGSFGHSGPKDNGP